MPHATDDANNLTPSSLARGFLDALPYRIGIRPILFGHRLVDDSHHRRALVIRARKLAPLEQRDTHHPKILRADRTEGGCRHARPDLLLAIHENGKDGITSGKRQRRGQRRLLHPWLSAHLFRSEERRVGNARSDRATTK